MARCPEGVAWAAASLRAVGPVSQFPSRWPPPLSQPPPPKPIAISSLYTLETKAPRSEGSLPQLPAPAVRVGGTFFSGYWRVMTWRGKRAKSGLGFPCLFSTAQNREQPCPESSHLRGKKVSRSAFPGGFQKTWRVSD